MSICWRVDSTEKKPARPTSIDSFRRCVGNHINIRCLFFGWQYRGERDVCLRNLLELSEDVPELSTRDFVAITWGSFAYDYIDRSFDGMRRIGQFFWPSGDIAEIRRLASARHPPGGIIWTPPLSFDMAAGRGYCRRNVLPRMEAGAEWVGYVVALEEIIGIPAPKGAGEERGAPNYHVGADVTRLFPLGKRFGRPGERPNDSELPTES